MRSLRATTAIVGVAIGLALSGISGMAAAGAAVPVAPVASVDAELDCNQPGGSSLIAGGSGNAWLSGSITGLTPGHSYFDETFTPVLGAWTLGTADANGVLTFSQIQIRELFLEAGSPVGIDLWDSTNTEAQFIGNVVTHPATRDPACGELFGGQEHGTLVSGNYRLLQQTDGNLVLYASGRAIWQTGTYGNPNAHTVVQGDGNLVTYSGTGRVLWQSQTAGTNPGNHQVTLTMQSDRNVVLYVIGPAVWQTHTYV
ncbi:MAG: mannose-specific lectin-like [Pseudonocardiales bacterium]|nr:mannose-specific lectin-like [Pseudonocardiales bacterium]